MSGESANGHAPSENGHVPDPIEQHIESLEALLEPLRDRRTELEVELLEISDQEERIATAVAALGGRKPKTIERQPRRVRQLRPRGTVPKTADGRKVPSEECLAAVRASFRDVTEPITVPGLTERLGNEWSPKTIGNAIAYLRDEEEVRVVGTRPGKGATPLYLPMETT